MSTKRQQPEFATEAMLCVAFLAWLKRYPDWTPYPETQGWDILLVHADGTQIGIQAKLKFNMAVLTQTIDSSWAWQEDGPDFRAVLVGAPAVGSVEICNALGITVLRPRALGNGAVVFDPDLKDNYNRDWHYCNPVKRCPLPAYVPDVACGVPSPSPLTKWKIGALEIVAVLELRGHVTRADFRVSNIDHRRWVELWLNPVPEAPGLWCWAPGRPEWEKNHPVVYPQIRDKMRERLGMELVLA